MTLPEDDGEVELAVGDDGPGIPSEDRDRVFERFTRLDASRTAGNGGAGLGLSIVQAVTVDHGGTIASPSPASAARSSGCASASPASSGPGAEAWSRPGRSESWTTG